MRIGVQYLKGTAAAGAAVGAGNSASFAPDEAPLQYKAVIDDLNSRGGLLGRRIVPVWYGQDNQSADNSTQDQAACAAFTDDNRVTAALLGGKYGTGLLNCLGRAGITTMSAPQVLTDDQVTFDQLPFYATSGELNLTRLASVLVDGLVRQKFFRPGAKIGLLTYDDPAYKRAVDRAMKPALARHGLALFDTVAVTPLTSVGATGQAAPQVQSGVLKFASEGVDHVVFFGSGGVAFIWMTSAESQQYRPRYGVSTNDAPSPLSANAPAAQLANTMGVGWNRMLDVANPTANAAAKRCDAIMRKAGLPTGAWIICDHVWGFANAVAAGGSLEPRRVIAGLELMRVPPPATVLAVRYTSRLRDGAAAAATLAYQAACKCFRYTSNPYPV